jgi:hypothetical protein
VPRYPASDLEPATLLRVAQGFACLFWGLAIALLLFTGTLRISLLDGWQLPRHAPAVLVITIGALLLWKSRGLSPGWHGRSFSLLAAALAQIYLMPFFRWWQDAPQMAFFGANMAAMLLATAWMLLAANLVAGELGHAVCNPVLVIESRLCGWSVILLASVLLALSVMDNVRDLFLRPLLAGQPLWLNTNATAGTWMLLHILISLPFLLTMATAWEARSQALAALAARHHCRPGDPRV